MGGPNLYGFSIWPSILRVGLKYSEENVKETPVAPVVRISEFQRCGRLSSSKARV